MRWASLDHESYGRSSISRSFVDIPSSIVIQHFTLISCRCASVGLSVWSEKLEGEETPMRPLNKKVVRDCKDSGIRFKPVHDHLDAPPVYTDL